MEGTGSNDLDKGLISRQAQSKTRAKRKATGGGDSGFIGKANPTSVRFSPYEGTVRVKRRREKRLRSRSGGGKRGPITQYTKAAQQRLEQELYSISGLQNHIVLTYPNAFPKDGPSAKKHISAFCRWMKTFGAGGIWVMEFQTSRDAPHFHILSNTNLEPKAARDKWLKVIGETDRMFDASAVCIEPIKDDFKIRSYIAKRKTKEVPSGFTSVGRFYGVFGKPARIQDLECENEKGMPYLIRALRLLDRKRRERLGWKRRRDNGLWSHNYKGWRKSEREAITRLFDWANSFEIDGRSEVTGFQETALSPHWILSPQAVNCCLNARARKSHGHSL